MSKLSILTNGILKENPSLVLVLGTCPTLAVTTMAVNGIGMGVATTLVLVGSNLVISLLRNIIPDKVRIPAFIVIIAGFVTVVQMLVQAYAKSVYDSLGIFLPLIVVNCIILGRAEMFASKNKVFDSVLDGLGMGLGFTLALFLMGSIREILSSATFFGMELGFTPITIFSQAPGGFFVFGCLIALVSFLTKGRSVKKKEMGCSGCPNAAACKQASEGGCE